MTIDDIKRFLKRASGVTPLALMHPNGKKAKDLEDLFTPLPLPNYSGLFLAKEGVFAWDIYKDKEWRVRILGPDFKG
jgi:hypothetical protein